jgi:hypothetical protein
MVAVGEKWASTKTGFTVMSRQPDCPVHRPHIMRLWQFFGCLRRRHRSRGSTAAALQQAEWASDHPRIQHVFDRDRRLEGPGAIAAAAWRTWIMNEQPPTAVPSTGWLRIHAPLKLMSEAKEVNNPRTKILIPLVNRLGPTLLMEQATGLHGRRELPRISNPTLIVSA